LLQKYAAHWAFLLQSMPVRDHDAGKQSEMKPAQVPDEERDSNVPVLTLSGHKLYRSSIPVLGA
jgi:hypothetical protein